MAGLDTALSGVVTWIGQNLLVDTVRIELPAVGDPVLDPDTGEVTRPAGTVLYEGPGAVQGAAQTQFTATPDALQPWAPETRSRYRLLTPLSAPVPPKDVIVTVTAVHDPARTALLGRSWTAQDPGQAGTVEVVRITPLDQNREAA